MHAWTYDSSRTEKKHRLELDMLLDTTSTLMDFTIDKE